MLIAHKKYLAIDEIACLHPMGMRAVLLTYMNTMRREFAEAGGGTHSTIISTYPSTGADILSVTLIEDPPPIQPPAFPESRIRDLESIRLDAAIQSDNHPWEALDGIRAVLHELGYRT